MTTTTTTTMCEGPRWRRWELAAVANMGAVSPTTMKVTVVVTVTLVVAVGALLDPSPPVEPRLLPPSETT